MKQCFPERFDLVDYTDPALIWFGCHCELLASLAKLIKKRVRHSKHMYESMLFWKKMK